MKIFDTIAQAKLARLTAGQLIRTKGKNSVNDGEGNTYLVQTAAYLGGFVSSALGGANTYDSTLADQIEIALKTVASQVDSNPRDVQASGTEQPHTTGQLEQLLDDLEAHTQAQVVNVLNKQAAVDAVPDTGDLPADIANVDAVTF